METKYRLESASIPRHASGLPPEYCAGSHEIRTEVLQTNSATFARIQLSDDAPKDYQVLTPDGAPYVLESYDEAKPLLAFLDNWAFNARQASESTSI